MTPATDLVEPRAPAAAASGRALSAALRLRDYEIASPVREGPTSIVYLAWDHALQRKVAIKEYMPTALVARLPGSPAVAARSERQREAFEAGLKGFVSESRMLARFDHPSLAKVYRFWEENGTAYTAMPHYEGPSLATALAELGHVPSESELRTWLKPVLNAVTVLHEGGVWHQNIAPDEIILTPVGPVLLGLGSAAHAIAQAQSTPAAALRPGFAAIEQYGSPAGTHRGPWTDFYALAAVIYAAITGDEPAPAAERVANDPVLPLSVIAAGLYSNGFLAAVDAAMQVRPESRPRNHLEFRALMGDIAPEAPVSLAPRRDLMQEPFIGARVDDREVTVPDHPLLVPAQPTLPPLPAPGGRPRPSAPMPLRDSGSAALATERASPSWVGHERAGGTVGKRTLFAFVAVSCFLVGAVALTVQFYMRQSAAAGSVASPPAGASAAGARAAAALRAAPAVVPATMPIVPSGVPAPTPVAPPRPGPGGSASPAPVRPPPGTVAATGALAAATTAAPASAAPRAPAEPPTAAPAAPAVTTSPGSTPAERQTRCIEILQKASLEPISDADTEFFKKECR